MCRAGRTDIVGVGPRQVGYTSYPNNLGTTPTNYGGRYDGPAYFMGAADVASVSGLAPTVTLAGITDGTSSTVIWSEMVRGRNGTTFSRPEPGLPHVSSTAVDDRLRPPHHIPQCLPEPRRPSRGSTPGSNLGDRFRGAGRRLRAHHDPEPKGLRSSRGRAQPVEYSAVCVGAQFVPPRRGERRFLDSSVRFVKDGVEPHAWRAVATRAGGEMITADKPLETATRRRAGTQKRWRSRSRAFAGGAAGVLERNRDDAHAPMVISEPTLFSGMRIFPGRRRRCAADAAVYLPKGLDGVEGRGWDRSGQEFQERSAPRPGRRRILAGDKPAVADDEWLPVLHLFEEPAQALQLVLHQERHDLGEVDGLLLAIGEARHPLALHERLGPGT